MMTLRMADSTVPANLPAGYDAYAGYVDGSWPDCAAIRARFPGVPVLSIAAEADADADCLDREPYDATAQEAPGWVRRQQARGVHRPCVYASVSNMAEVIGELTRSAILRAEVRLWSAHYGAGEHICGPATCKWPDVPAMDGTQWSDSQPGAGGSQIDASILLDGFFGGTVPPGWQEDMMRQLPTLRAGAKGADVRSIQGLCVARGHALTVDGVFGPVTEAAVRAVQKSAGAAVDGVVGPVTWSALLGV